MRIQRVGDRVISIGGPRFVMPRGGAAAANWWEVAGKTCVAAYQPKGAASLAASYVNLANPGTNDAAEGVAPSFDAATGWTFNGSTQYLITGLQPRRTWSALVQFTDMTSPAANYHDLLGFYINNQNAFDISVVNAGTNRMYMNNCAITPLVIVGIIASGNMAIGGNVAYLDGASEGSWGYAAADNTGTNCYIAAVFYSGAAYNFTAVRIQAVALYSDTLSAAEVATVSAAMAAL